MHDETKKSKKKSEIRDMMTLCQWKIMMQTIIFFLAYSICRSMLIRIRTSFSRTLSLNYRISSRKMFSRMNSAKSDGPLIGYSNNSTSSELHRMSNDDIFISLRSYGQKSILPFSRQSVLSCIILAAATKAARKATADIIISPVVDENAVIKRESDTREYLPLTISNGMRVLLISDKATVRSAAAMDVHVGSFSDPKDLQGLAHFTGPPS